MVSDRQGLPGSQGQARDAGLGELASQALQPLAIVANSPPLAKADR